MPIQSLVLNQLISGLAVATSQYRLGHSETDIFSGLHPLLPSAELEDGLSPAVEPLRRLASEDGRLLPDLAPQSFAGAFYEAARQLAQLTQESHPPISIWADDIRKVWRRGLSHPPAVESGSLAVNLQNDEALLIEWLRQFVEFSPQPMGVVKCHPDGSAEMVLFNRKNRERWGLNEQDVVGVAALRFFYPEDHDMVRAVIRECLETGSATRSGIRILRRAGGHLLVDVHFGRVDATNYAYFQAIDETEREQAFEQVRIRDAVFRNAQKPLLMLRFDESGSPSAMVTTAGFDRMLGYRPGEIGVKPVMDFIPKALRPAFKERLRRFLETGTLTWPAVELIGKGGTSVLVDIEASDSGDKDQKFAIVSFGDAEARIAAEKNAMEAERLKIISEVSAAIAHDANNLITVISGLIQLSMEIDSGSDGYKESYQEIMENIDMLTEMLKGFRQMTDTVSGELNLHSLLKRSTIQTIVPKVAGVIPTFALTEDPWTVAGPNFAVWQIIYNIIKNAIESMMNSGRKSLHLTTENVSLPHETALRRLDPENRYPGAKPGDYLMLSVQDTGTGIPPEMINRLFEDYFSTKSDSEVRRGRGLHATQQAIAQRGGLLTVRSTVGEGTIFEIYLPRADEPDEPAASSVSVAATGMLDQRWISRGNEVVLIADDDEALRDQYDKILRKYFGYKEVLFAGTTQEALKVVEERPDLSAIVMDWRMPGDTGDTVLGELRVLRPRLPILVNTALVPEHRHLYPGVRFTTKLRGMNNVARAIRRLIDGDPIDS
jgi:PAS domain S-box-containing protein